MGDDHSQLMRALYDQHGQALFAYAMRLTGDQTAAHALVQESMQRAWRSPGVLGHSDRSARAWLFTVARDIAIDQSRSTGVPHEVPTDHLPTPALAEDLDAALQSWQVVEALLRLSDEHRRTVFECYYHGHTVAEAAAAFGVPEGTIKARLHYGLRALRLILAEMGVDSG